MSGYIHFTEAEKQQAAAVDLEAFLESRGEKLLRSGREKRLSSDHSITVRGNSWYDHAAERGGGPVSFVRERYSMSYPEAMQFLLGGDAGIPYPAASEKPKEEPKEFELPPVNSNMRRVYAYLTKHRHINRWVLNCFAKAGLIYEDAKYHNCVFVGKDENGIARHAHKRSSNSYGNAFRLNIEGGDPRYSFHFIGTSGRLYVFEAPIDLLSFISLYPHDWQQHSYVACCGVSFQPVQKMLERMSSVETVYLCLDNDKAGNMASERMANALKEQGVSSVRLIPQNKDWNEALVSLDQPANKMESGVQNSCQAFGC